MTSTPSVDAFLGRASKPETVCYCRVSSAKQRGDLQRQCAQMRSLYPNAEIIRDIGGGLNWKRQGLLSILERIHRGDKLTLVVAHRDRLARFGFELIEWLVQQNGGQVLVLHQPDASPQSELTEDLLAVLHTFSCRMHGLPLAPESCYSHQRGLRSFRSFFILFGPCVTLALCGTLRVLPFGERHRSLAAAPHSLHGISW